MPTHEPPRPLLWGAIKIKMIAILPLRPRSTGWPANQRPKQAKRQPLAHIIRPLEAKLLVWRRPTSAPVVAARDFRPKLPGGKLGWLISALVGQIAGERVSALIIDYGQ